MIQKTTGLTSADAVPTGQGDLLMANRGAAPGNEKPSPKMVHQLFANSQK